MAEHTEHQHPTIGQYWKIAGLLAVLTAIEVALFYIDEALELGTINVVLLIILALLKFVIVVGWYMHLRFERPLLNRFFGAGFVMALFLYGVVLAAMGIIVIRAA
ncbi:MAG TPA: cytochrome C oxidase subunit IV family protein [Acidimicrobiia bacterium]|jgi:cytochrome c oxidase subunit 4|nr:cytochrome C oxidase subunit IV family protein [Acidimicrobiia bacterium]